MISQVSNQANLRLWDSFQSTTDKIRHDINSSFNKSTEVAHQAALTVLSRIALDVVIDVTISLPLFYYFPNLFHIGLVSGFFFHRQVREIVDEVNGLYLYMENRDHSYIFNLIKKVALIGMIGIYCIMNMPPSILTATLYYSAKWGALLRTRSISIKDQMKPLAARLSSPMTASAPQLRTSTS